MTALDETIFRRKSEQLRTYLHYLEEFRKIPRETFVSDHHHFGLAEHYLHQAIEVVLDIARSVVAGLDVPLPDDAHGLFEILADRHVLPREFAEAHRRMVGLRNRLVHEYADVDHEKVHDYLREHLGAFHEFLRYVATHLERTRGS